jgi:hypothetical protein
MNILRLLTTCTLLGLSALPAFAATYNETGGSVCIEAEHYDSKTSALSRTWEIKTETSASAGVAMRAGPDSGTTAASKAGPALVFKVKINSSGSYYINVRGRGPDGSGDSVYAAFNSGTAANLSVGSSGYVWKQSGTFSLSAGTHTLYVWMREDGVVVDKVVASKSSTLPTGTGPAESAIVGTSSSTASSVSSSKSSSVASSAASSVSNNGTPYGVLSLTNWKITIPYDGSDSGSDADEIKGTTFKTYSNTGWFWADSDKIWVNFKCNAGSPTTSGSDNPRSELREMKNDGTNNNEIAWSMTTSTVYKQEGICKVTNTPSSGKLAFAQIHSTLDSYDDIIRLQVRLSGSNHVLYVMGSCVSDTADDIRTQTVGSEINYKIEASNSEVRVYLDGSLKRTYKNDMTKSPTNYFKAGNYLQSKPSSGYGLVKYRYLKTNK